MKVKNIMKKIINKLVIANKSPLSTTYFVGNKSRYITKGTYQNQNSQYKKQLYYSTKFAINIHRENGTFKSNKELRKELPTVYKIARIFFPSLLTL